MKVEVLDIALHKFSSGDSFLVAIIDDAGEGDVKLAVSIGPNEPCAVLSLDRIIEEDISTKGSPKRQRGYETKIREVLWTEARSRGIIE